MDANALTVAFSPAQLAIFLLVALGGLAIVARWSVHLIQNTLDLRFQALHERLSQLQNRVDEIPDKHPSKEYVDLQVQLVTERQKNMNRRITDLGVFVHGPIYAQRSDDSQP